MEQHKRLLFYKFAEQVRSMYIFERIRFFVKKVASSWHLLVLLFGLIDFVLLDAQPLAPQLIHVLHHRVQDGEEDE